MVNLAILHTQASDWIGQTWAQRLKACAETLYVHGAIDFDTWNTALDRLDEASELHRSAGLGNTPAKSSTGHFCLMPKCTAAAPVGTAFCLDHRGGKQPNYANLNLGSAAECEGRN